MIKSIVFDAINFSFLYYANSHSFIHGTEINSKALIPQNSNKIRKSINNSDSWQQILREVFAVVC